MLVWIYKFLWYYQKEEKYKSQWVLTLEEFENKQSKRYNNHHNNWQNEIRHCKYKILKKCVGWPKYASKFFSISFSKRNNFIHVTHSPNIHKALRISSAIITVARIFLRKQVMTVGFYWTCWFFVCLFVLFCLGFLLLFSNYHHYLKTLVFQETLRVKAL